MTQKRKKKRPIPRFVIKQKKFDSGRVWHCVVDQWATRTGCGQLQGEDFIVAQSDDPFRARVYLKIAELKDEIRQALEDPSLESVERTDLIRDLRCDISRYREQLETGLPSGSMDYLDR